MGHARAGNTFYSERTQFCIHILNTFYTLVRQVGHASAGDASAQERCGIVTCWPHIHTYWPHAGDTYTHAPHTYTHAAHTYTHAAHTYTHAAHTYTHAYLHTLCIHCIHSYIHTLIIHTLIIPLRAGPCGQSKICVFRGARALWRPLRGRKTARSGPAAPPNPRGVRVNGPWAMRGGSNAQARLLRSEGTAFRVRECREQHFELPWLARRRTPSRALGQSNYCSTVQCNYCSTVWDQRFNAFKL